MDGEKLKSCKSLASAQKIAEKENGIVLHNGIQVFPATISQYKESVTIAKDTQNFKVNEFTCKCGCGKNNIDQRIIDMAETIHKTLGVPVHVNSGYR